MKMRLEWMCLWLVIIAAGSCLVYGSELVVSTADPNSADTYLNYFKGHLNYGSDTALQLSKNYVPYLKFDVSDAGTNNITAATLTLYGTPDPLDPPGYDWTFNVYGLMHGSDDWKEDSITYNNAPLVFNPISAHPYLVHLGTLEYTNGDANAITMINQEQALVEFLNNRGPDKKVTIIIASDRYTVGKFFSTKEDHGDGSEAPFLQMTVDDVNVVPGLSWTGASSDDWNTADNWLNELEMTDIPDSADTVLLAGGSNYPVQIDADSYAAKLFVDAGGIDLNSGTLNLDTGVLRIDENVSLYMNGGEMILGGNQAFLVDLFFGQGRITCDPGKELYAEWIDPNDPNVPGETMVSLQKEVPSLVWPTQIVSVIGDIGVDGSCDAVHCVDGSGLYGSMHARWAECNSYYGRQLGPAVEPVIEIGFDKPYTLTEMWVWNYEESNDGYALRDVRIEYSTNGTDWTTLMNGINPLFRFSMGNKDGSVNDVINFGGAQARYVRLTAVGGAGQGNYEFSSNYGSYLLRELRFYYDEPRARNPQPADNSEVDINVTLQWTPGVGAVTGQDVWFGTSELSMTKVADNISPDAYQWPLAELDDDQDYFWRVDGLDSGGSTTMGYVWSFTARARLNFPDGGIIDTHESHAAWDNSATYGASRVVDRSGLTGDIHSVDVAGTYWYGRTPDADPPEVWAAFTFDHTYYLEQMYVWNCDANDLDDPDRALKQVRIEYSALDDPTISDPCDWTILMDGANPYFTWTKSEEGQISDIVDFDDAVARHVKITAIGGKGVGNYGSNNGYLVNELRIHHNGICYDVVAAAPTPKDGYEVDVFVELGWTPGLGAVTGQDIWLGETGQPLQKIASNIDPATNTLGLPQLDNYTNYTWRVDGLDGGGSTMGPEWTFTTRARLRWNPGGLGVVAAVGSVGDNGAPGVRAVNESGLDYDLHAGFQWSNGWYCRLPFAISLDEPPLDIEFDRVYPITDMWVWNHDGISPTEAAMAIKTVKIEYSTDGVNYDTIMNGMSETFVLPHGNTDGTHDTVIAFDVPVRFVRFTPVGGQGVGNYGSHWGFKLRELRFYYDVPLWSDLDGDGDSDIDDLRIMAFDWLADNWIEDPEPVCTGRPEGDANGDCVVDYVDFAIIGGEWLEQMN